MVLRSAHTWLIHCQKYCSATHVHDSYAHARSHTTTDTFSAHHHTANAIPTKLNINFSLVFFIIIICCVWETRLHRTECPRKCWITHVKCQNISSFRRTFKLNRIQTANNIFLINFFDGYVSSRANGFQYPLNLTWLGRISKLIRRETTKIYP